VESLKVVACVDAEGPVEETPEVRASLISKPCFGSWAEIEGDLALFNAHRHSFHDSEGGPAKLSWFIADNVGWVDNPRRRATGFGAVWDRIMNHVQPQDSVGWHHHALPPSRRALDSSTTWTYGLPLAEEVLCRRLLKYGWFPSTFRAGGAIMRPDLSAWLDMFIPIDYTWHPPVGGPGEAMDWRDPTAYTDWADGARRLVRTCELRSTTYRMGEKDIEFAWEMGMPLAFAIHDRRSVYDDITYARGLIQDVLGDRPWRWANAVEAAEGPVAPVKWEITQQKGVYYFTADQPIFGQPFLAVVHRGVYWRDCPTQEGVRRWAYNYRYHAPLGSVKIHAWPRL